ncbi:MAG: TolC family protein [Bacteroidota bacterium]|nr:TolC family protein [Bacteroidota bacterium]
MMKQRKALWLVVLNSLLLAIPALAQNKKYSLSADEAVAIAFKKITEIRNLQLDSVIQFQKNKEITGSALPQVNGTVSSSHYYGIPVTVLPDFLSPSIYNVLNKEGVKDGSGNTIQVPSSFGTFPAQFGVPWTASAGFTVSQLLFQPDVFVGLKARSTSMKYVSGNIQVMKDSIKSNVYRSYYAVLIGEKRLAFLKDGVKRLEKLLYDQEVMYKNGFIERLDLDKTQVSLNNLRTTEMQVENGVSLGYAALKFAVGIAQKDTLVLVDTLSSSTVKKDILSYEAFQYGDRPEYRLLSSVKTLQELDLERNKLQFIPTISAFWSYNKNAQRQQFDFFNKGDWFTTNLVGINMSVPIWSSGQRIARINQSKFSLDKTNNSIDQLKQAIDLQQEVAKAQLVNALGSLDIQERNLELAERVYNTTKKKYEQGLGSSFELLQIEQSLEDAQSNYFQSLYDAVVAKVGLLKSIGKL